MGEGASGRGRALCKWACTIQRPRKARGPACKGPTRRAPIVLAARGARRAAQACMCACACACATRADGARAAHARRTRGAGAQAARAHQSAACVPDTSWSLSERAQPRARLGGQTRRNRQRWAGGHQSAAAASRQPRHPCGEGVPLRAAEAGLAQAVRLPEQHMAERKRGLLSCKRGLLQAQATSLEPCWRAQCAEGSRHCAPRTEAPRNIPARHRLGGNTHRKVASRNKHGDRGRAGCTRGTHAYAYAYA